MIVAALESVITGVITLNKKLTRGSQLVTETKNALIQGVFCFCF